MTTTTARESIDRGLCRSCGGACWFMFANETSGYLCQRCTAQAVINERADRGQFRAVKVGRLTYDVYAREGCGLTDYGRFVMAEP